MDVNGTRFHLFKGQEDWNLRIEEEKHLAWDEARGALSLRPVLTLFRNTDKPAPFDATQRKGAARDANGNTFWIAQDSQTLFWLPAGDSAPTLFWSQNAPPAPAPSGEFQPSVPPTPEIFSLAGLAVTTHHYLVVGYTGTGTQVGGFLFDLSAGGPPTRLIFPTTAAKPFAPYDMAANDSGGVWILDRVHKSYWGLDREFRLVGTPEPFPLTADPHPVAIEALPDHHVLVLSDPLVAGTGPSSLTRYRLGKLVAGPVPLVAKIEVVVEGETVPKPSLEVVGYDMALVSETTLYVLEQAGNQAIEFRLELTRNRLSVMAKETYLPLLFFGGRRLVVEDEQVFYEVKVGADQDRQTRWVPLKAIEQPRYDLAAQMLTPILDGKERDCVWHRLFLDMCLPAETKIEVWTRAANSQELLVQKPFLPEPPLYRRSRGAELAYFDPFHGDPDPEKGTYETLLQEAVGRYLQVKLVWSGNGRTTPFVHHLRIYYPRFSYVEHYLPALYQDDADSLQFLNRFLANPEGLFSEIEGKIEHFPVLLDARSAPPETLDWLAGWVGLVVDPLWEKLTPTADRRRLLIRFARLLYERRGTPEGILFALHLLLDPCLEGRLERLKALAVGLEERTRQELETLRLPMPTPASTDSDLEDLLYQVLVSPRRVSPVRLVEAFRARTPENNEAAHRFSVLIPQGVRPEEGAMVRRIIQLEKPAHTLFDVRLYWEGFRVGTARLGLDTALGESARYLPILLGESALTNGYLSAHPPMDAPDRLISDRDALGELPRL